MELVTRGKLQFFQPPKEGVDLDFKQCCYENLVFGSLTDIPETRHEIFASYYQKEISGTTIEYYLQIVGSFAALITNDQYGRFRDFGDFADNPNLSFFECDWNKVLQLEGEGTFQIRKEITINGTTYIENSFYFTLMEYSNRLADTTIRWDVEYDGYLVHKKTDFKGTQLKSSLRFMGFFGDRNPQINQEVYVKSNDNNRADGLNFRQDEDNKVQVQNIPSCISKVIIDEFHFASFTWFSDFNIVNHDWDLRRIPVVYESHDDPDYNKSNRLVTLNYVFKNRFKNTRRTRN